MIRRKWSTIIRWYYLRAQTLLTFICIQLLYFSIAWRLILEEKSERSVDSPLSLSLFSIIHRFEPGQRFDLCFVFLALRIELSKGYGINISIGSRRCSTGISVLWWPETMSNVNRCVLSEMLTGSGLRQTGDGYSMRFCRWLPAWIQRERERERERERRRDAFKLWNQKLVRGTASRQANTFLHIQIHIHAHEQSSG